MRVVVLSTQEEVAQKSLELLSGPRVALLGGSTFTALAHTWVPEVSRRVREGQVLRFFPVDERNVPFDDAASNWKSVYENLLAPTGLEEQRTHHVTAAAEYAALLKTEFGSGPVVFDSVFLGIGEDGHTASLFPDKDAVRDVESVVINVFDSPKAPAKRVTLGLRPIRESRVLVAVALGKGKAEVVRRLVSGDETLPITQATKDHPYAILLIDQEAASAL